MVYVIYRKDGKRIDGCLWRVSDAPNSFAARRLIADTYHIVDSTVLGWNTLARLQTVVDIRGVDDDIGSRSRLWREENTMREQEVS